MKKRKIFYFCMWPLIALMLIPRPVINAEGKKYIQKKYIIRAEKLSDAVRQLARFKPHTRANFSLDYELKQAGNEILISQGQVFLTNEVWIPFWDAPTPSARTGWDSVLNPLIKHEEEHARINQETSLHMQRELQNLRFSLHTHEPLFEHAHTEVKLWFQSRMAELKNRHQALDFHASQPVPASAAD